MRKLIFGMRFLRETQIENGSYSHKNLLAVDYAGKDSMIESWVALDGTYKVLAIFPYSTTGFSNTMLITPCDEKGQPEKVLCADGIERNVTIALSHDNSLNYKKGDLIVPGSVIYDEGIAGKATGNHIHCEMGEGIIYSKVKASDGQWKMPRELYPSKVFFLLSGYHEIQEGNKRYKWTETEGEKMKLKEGYQLLTHLGQKIHVYKQCPDEKMGLISAKGNIPYKAVDDITRIDDDRIHACKVNWNYFDMKTGQHYGVEISPQNEFVPHTEEYLALYQLKDEQELNTVKSSDFWLTRGNVEFACTPFATLFNKGKDCKMISSGVGNKLGIRNTQTFVMGFEDGRHAFGVCSGKLTPEQCVTFAKQFEGLNHISFGDSGGSSQMIVNRVKKVYTGRKIPNVLTFYKVKNQNETKGDEDMLKKIHVDKVGLYIRDKVKGKIIGFIPASSNHEFEEVKPVDHRQSDGYQWFQVKGSWTYKGKEYKDQIGYCQYDSSCYWVE